MRRSLLIIFILFSGLLLQAQGGCTDPLANNYSASATVNDGSCTYDATGFMPQIKYELPAEVLETSGLIFNNGKLYTFNDSGGAAVIYRLDSLNGQIDQRITISNAQNIDWEDIAKDANYLYIGDFGNNLGNRTDLMIYRIPLSSIPADGDISISADIINFSFSDQTDFSVRNRDHDHDCEAMIVDQQNIHLFSKNWIDGNSKWYTLPKTPGTHTAQYQQSFASNGLITGADISADGTKIALVGYVENVWQPFIWLMFDYDGTQYFSGNKRRIDFPLLLGNQMEAIAYEGNSNLFISAEQTQVANQRLFRLSTSSWINSQNTALSEIDVPFTIEISPNPVKRGNVEIRINGLFDDFEINIIDSTGKVLRSKYLKSNQTEYCYRIKINKKHLQSGIYFIHLNTKKHKLVKKLIIL